MMSLPRELLHFDPWSLHLRLHCNSCCGRASARSQRSKHDDSPHLKLRTKNTSAAKLWLKQQEDTGGPANDAHGVELMF